MSSELHTYKHSKCVIIFFINSALNYLEKEKVQISVIKGEENLKDEEVI